MAIKILSVDDELDLEILLTQYFRRKIKKGEYEFHFAHNGLEALQMLLAMPDFDVILSDINMPEMDGLTLLTKINEMRNPALKCIMVSAYGDMENIRSAMNQGAFDFTTKPINLEDLERTIEKAAEQIAFIKQAQREHTQLESIQNDLHVAQEIQQTILPKTFPPFPKLKSFDLYAYMNAAKYVGGDFYDFFRIDQDRLGFVIADVSGKGVPAAIFMAISRTAKHLNPLEKEFLIRKFKGNSKVKLSDFCTAVWNKMIKTEILCGFTFVDTLNEDVEASYEFYTRATGMVETNQKLYHYFMNDTGITRSKFSRKDLDYLVVWNRIVERTQKEHPEYSEYAIASRKRANFTLLSKMMIRGYNKNDKELCAVHAQLKKKVRKDFFDLMKIKMPLSRKILLLIEVL